MAKKAQGALDDSLSVLSLSDFSGGLNTYDDILDLQPNETPDMQNFLPFAGRLVYRGGSSIFCSGLPSTPDAAFIFFDSSGNRHMAVFASGNLYDCAAGSAILIASACYTQQSNKLMCAVAWNGNLYFSNQVTAVSKWTVNSGVAVINYTSTLGVPNLFASAMCLYAGSIMIAGSTTSNTNSTLIYATFVNDPTQILTGQAQVSNLDGGLINFIIPLGSAGFRSILCGTNRDGIYILSGPANQLSINAVNMTQPVSCYDGRSAVYAPFNNQYGAVVFFATDYQFYQTDGINCFPISRKITPTLYTDAANSIALNLNATITAGYNARQQYYICDLGNNIQYVYKWFQAADGNMAQAWTKFTNIQSGYLFNGLDGNRFPALFTANPLGILQLDIDNAPDAQSVPSVYWTSPYLHCGDVTREKEFAYAAITNNNTATTFAIQAQAMATRGTTTQQTPVYTVSPASGSGSSLTLIWSQGKWNVNYWGPGLTTTVISPAISKVALNVQVPHPYDSSAPLMSQPLRAPAIQLTVSYYAGQMSPVLLSAQLYYYNRARRFVGAQQHSSVIEQGTQDFPYLHVDEFSS